MFNSSSFYLVRGTAPSPRISVSSPFYYGRRGWRLRRRQRGPRRFFLAAFFGNLALYPTRFGVLALERWYLRCHRNRFNLKPIPVAMPLYLPPFRRNWRVGFRPVFGLPFFGRIKLPIRRRGMRRWVLISSLHRCLSVMGIYGRRRTRRKLRLLFSCILRFHKVIPLFRKIPSALTGLPPAPKLVGRRFHFSFLFMPQLDELIFFPLFFWTFLLFFVVYLFLVKFFLPRVLCSLKFRRVYRGRLNFFIRRAAVDFDRLTSLFGSMAAARQSVSISNRTLSRTAIEAGNKLAELRWQFPESALPLRPLFVGSNMPYSVEFSSLLGVSISFALPVKIIVGAPFSLFPRLIRILVLREPVFSVESEFFFALAEELVGVPEAVALLVVFLAQRRIYTELFLWLDPFESLSPLEDLLFPPLRNHLYQELTFLPSLL